MACRHTKRLRSTVMYFRTAWGQCCHQSGCRYVVGKEIFEVSAEVLKPCSYCCRDSEQGNGFGAYKQSEETTYRSNLKIPKCIVSLLHKQSNKTHNVTIYQASSSMQLDISLQNEIRRIDAIFSAKDTSEMKELIQMLFQNEQHQKLSNENMRTVVATAIWLFQHNDDFLKRYQIDMKNILELLTMIYWESPEIINANCPDNSEGYFIVSAKGASIHISSSARQPLFTLLHELMHALSWNGRTDDRRAGLNWENPYEWHDHAGKERSNNVKFLNEGVTDFLVEQLYQPLRQIIHQNGLMTQATDNILDAYLGASALVRILDQTLPEGSCGLAYCKHSLADLIEVAYSVAGTDQLFLDFADSMNEMQSRENYNYVDISPQRQAVRNFIIRTFEHKCQNYQKESNE